MPCPHPGAPQREPQRERNGAEVMERGQLLPCLTPTSDPNPSLEFCPGKGAGAGGG